MAKKRGLGRGLDALLSSHQAARQAEPATPEEVAAREGELRELPVEFIQRGKYQPRRDMNPEALEELANSIRAQGVMQPIVVRPLGPDRYEIVAGERRWRAAQLAGLAAVPVLVRELTDMQVLEIGVIENVQRADLSPIEEATAYKQLMDRFGRTQDSVAEAVGKSRSHVANTLRLLALPEGVRTHLLEGRLSAGHARAIATAPNAEALAEEIIARGLSVREAEALGRTAPGRTPRAAKARRRPKDVDTLALENDLADVLGLEVSIDDAGGSGAITIRYETLEQLDDVCRRLTR